MQQLVDNTSVANCVTDLIEESSARLSQSLNRLENAVLQFSKKRDQVRNALVEELDGYIAELKVVIDAQQVSDANS